MRQRKYSASPQYQMLRIRRQTHARLKRLQDRIRQLYSEGKLSLPDDEVEYNGREGPSFDFLCNYLVDRLEDDWRRKNPPAKDGTVKVEK